MDISKLSRHTHLAKQAIAQALGLGKDGLKNFKPPKKIPGFSDGDPLNFVSGILTTITVAHSEITPARAAEHLCGPKGAAALLAKSLLTTTKSTDSFNSLVADQAKKINNESGLNTFNDGNLKRYINNNKRGSKTTARDIDCLKLLCAAILLYAAQNEANTTYDLKGLNKVSPSYDPPMPQLAKDATEDQQDTIRTIATDLAQQKLLYENDLEHLLNYVHGAWERELDSTTKYQLTYVIAPPNVTQNFYYLLNTEYVQLDQTLTAYWKCDHSTTSDEEKLKIICALLSIYLKGCTILKPPSKAPTYQMTRSAEDDLQEQNTLLTALKFFLFPNTNGSQPQSKPQPTKKEIAASKPPQQLQHSKPKPEPPKVEIATSTPPQELQTSPSTTNSKEHTSNNLLANYQDKPIKIPHPTGWGKTEDVEINLISYITPPDYEQLKQIASDLQKLNDTCKTHLDLETLLVDKFPKIPQSNKKYILSPDTTANSDNRDDNRSLKLDYQGLICRSSTITFYFESTRNQLNTMKSQDITQDIISLVKGHKYGFICLKGDSTESPICKQQKEIIEKINQILFPPGHEIPTISTNPDSDNDTSPWEQTLEDLVDSVTKLPTDLPFNIPSNYETHLNAIESKTNGVHCNLLEAIKKDILDVGIYMLENRSAPNTSQRKSDDPSYANEKYAAKLDKVIDHIKKIEETSAHSINDWLKNFLHIPENLQYLRSNPLTENVLSAITRQVDFLQQKLLHHSLWQMYDNIQKIKTTPPKGITFTDPNAKLPGFFQTLDEFWTAIVESATRTRNSPQQPQPEQTLVNNWQNIVNLCKHLNYTYKTIPNNSELNAYTFADKLGEWFTNNLNRTYTYFLNDQQQTISLGLILENFILLHQCPFLYEQYKLLFSLISTYAPGTKFTLNYDGKNVETYPIKLEDLNKLFAALFN